MRNRQQLIDAWQTPVIMTAKHQPIAVGLGLGPSASYAVIRLLPHQPGLVVGDRDIERVGFKTDNRDFLYRGGATASHDAAVVVKAGQSTHGDRHLGGRLFGLPCRKSAGEVDFLQKPIIGWINGRVF